MLGTLIISKLKVSTANCYIPCLLLGALLVGTGFSHAQEIIPRLKREPKKPKPRPFVEDKEELKVKPFLWAQAENFTEKGTWKNGHQGTHKFLAANHDKNSTPAKTSFELTVPADCRVWVLARSYSEQIATCNLSINKRNGNALQFKPSKQFVWQSLGAIQLDDGDVELILSAPAGSTIQVDCILLTTDFTFRPSGPGKPDNLKQTPEKTSPHHKKAVAPAPSPPSSR